jgi:hypothetical protein
MTARRYRVLAVVGPLAVGTTFTSFQRFRQRADVGDDLPDLVVGNLCGGMDLETEAPTVGGDASAGRNGARFYL